MAFNATAIIGGMKFESPKQGWRHWLNFVIVVVSLIVAVVVDIFDYMARIIPSFHPENTWAIDWLQNEVSIPLLSLIVIPLGLIVGTWVMYWGITKERNYYHTQLVNSWGIRATWNRLNELGQLGETLKAKRPHPHSLGHRVTDEQKKNQVRVWDADVQNGFREVEQSVAELCGRASCDEMVKQRDSAEATTDAFLDIRQPMGQLAAVLKWLHAKTDKLQSQLPA